MRESLAFISSTLEQSVVFSSSGAKQRRPFLSEVYVLPTHARPVAGEEGIKTQIRRLEEEWAIYFRYAATAATAIHGAGAQCRVYGMLREVIELFDDDNDAGNTVIPSGQPVKRGEECVVLHIDIGRVHPMEEREDASYGTGSFGKESNSVGKKFSILYKPCTNLCVVGTTGRRPPSKLLEYTSRLLAALTGTVCSDTPGRYFNTGGNEDKAAVVTSGVSHECLVIERCQHRRFVCRRLRCFELSLLLIVFLLSHHMYFCCVIPYCVTTQL